MTIFCSNNINRLIRHYSYNDETASKLKNQEFLKEFNNSVVEGHLGSDIIAFVKKMLNANDLETALMKAENVLKYDEVGDFERTILNIFLKSYNQFSRQFSANLN